MEKDIKSSVRLPKTNFEMKANLKELDEEVLKSWDQQNIYQQILDKNLNSPKFILHDGPPYANGHIHLGHSLNKILKDIIVKAYITFGYSAPFVLGWDCHGLPIEWKIEELNKEKGINKNDVPIIAFRKQCVDFAHSWVEIQSNEFKKLGIIADFNNPYLTTNPNSESIIISCIFKLLKSGAIYQGKKPVMWSTVEQTALAEAEVEYRDKKSDTVYVSLNIVKSFRKSWINAKAIIWTTTPWTLPSNQAIAYNKNIKYGLYNVLEVSDSSLCKVGDKLVVACELAKNVFDIIGVQGFSLIEDNLGLEGIEVEHPLYKSGYNEVVPALNGDFVDISVGSGIVHIAPAHGEDDFYLCKVNNITPKILVLDNGLFAKDVISFSGEHIFKINPVIVSHLKNNGNLLNHTVITHSYPHSWRSKAPLIYNLTSQWFISLDYDNLRKKAIDSLETINFHPKAGKNRLKSMLENRPDWCISRQRCWGVPLGIFLNIHDNTPLIDEEVFENIIKAVNNEGSDAWFKEDPRRFLTSKYNKQDYKPIMDVVDVWLDSGLSNAYVLNEREYLSHPADIYVEGSDQHRGWFQSSLVMSLLVFNKSPFKNILTHGFTLDEKGQKMSKSLGNVLDPIDIINNFGADILRIWVANSNYIEDVSFGKNILTQQIECYRKIRNVMKYLLGNLSYEFEKIEYKNLLEIDKWLLHNLYELDDLYENTFKSNYNFHSFFNKLFNFISLELSAFYFDIKKDVLYCDNKDSLRFKSTLSAFEILFELMLKWLAPFIPITMEEAYSKRYNKKIGTLFLHNFIKAQSCYENNLVFNKWERIKKIRKVITGAIELKRGKKEIGSSLEVSPIVYLSEYDDLELLKSIDFAEVCITSHITIEMLGSNLTKNLFFLEDVIGVYVDIKKYNGHKCERCWKYFEELQEYNVCLRCLDEVKNI